MFRIFFPLADSSSQAAQPSAPTEETPGGGESVLLVEDEEPVRTFLKRALEMLGYTVRETGDTAAALNLLEEGAPADILITDMVMPGMAGTKLAERARALRTGLRVLYISGYADRSLVKKALADKGSQFLQKPFSPAQLAQKVRQILDAR